MFNGLGLEFLDWWLKSHDLKLENYTPTDVRNVGMDENMEQGMAGMEIFTYLQIQLQPSIWNGPHVSLQKYLQK